MNRRHVTCVAYSLAVAVQIAAASGTGFAQTQPAPAPSPAPAVQAPAVQAPVVQAPAAQAPADPHAHDHTATAAPADPNARSPSPADAYVYIGWPVNNAVIRSTRVRIWFGTRNFGVAPAGTYNPNTGHHHLLIDTDLPALNEPIPNDRNHLHFGKGQTETVIELPPGKHTLQLLMGDGNHVPHDPPLTSAKITIFVRPG